MKLYGPLVSLALLALAATPVRAQRIDIHLDSEPAISPGCPARLHFLGEIRTFEPLHVTYQWLRSDGSHTEHSVTFGHPGPHPISEPWTISGNYNGWMQLVILEPKHLQTIRSRFSVHCR